MVEILVMGPRNCGKSLFVERLQMLSEEHRLTPFDSLHLAHPTEGIDIKPIRFRNTLYQFKELGGASIEEYPRHAESATGIIYVFDAVDLTTVPSNIVWLNCILTDPNLEQKPVLVLLSKCDIPDCIRFNVIDKIIGFDRLLNPTRLTLLEMSAVLGVGLNDVTKWAANISKEKKA